MADEYVTDPDLLSKLNAPDKDSGYVSDPKLLEQLNAPSSWGEVGWDVAKQVPTAVATGLEGLITGPARLMGLAGRGLEAIGLGGDPERAAEQQKIRELAEQQGGAQGIAQYLPKPTTETGRLTRAGVEGAVAATAGAPGRLAVAIPAGIAGGVASEIGGEATAGTPLEVPTRIAGAVLGTGAVTGAAAGLRAATGAAAEASAGSRLARAFARDRDTPEAALQRLQQIRQVRPEATLADVGGENVRGLLEGVAQTPGAGRADVIGKMTARQQAQASRIINDLSEATGTRQTAFRAFEDTMAARKEAAAPLYERAYADGEREVWDPSLERLAAAPFVQAAMRRAMSTWRNQAVADGYGAMNPTQIERGGQIVFGGAVPVFPNIQFWDYTKRMLDDMTGQALRAGQNQKARTLTTLTTQLRDSLDRQVPSYAQARNAWAGPSRYMDAIDEGKSILNKNMTAEELRSYLSGLSDAEREGYRIGAVSTIANSMVNNPAKLADMTRYIRSEGMRAKLSEIMSPEAAARFNQALDFEMGASELTGQTLRGSQTARRLAMQEEASSVFGDLVLHTLGHGPTLPIMRQIWNGAINKPVRDKLRARADQLLSETLLASEPKIPRGAPWQAVPLIAGTALRAPGFKRGGVNERTQPASFQKGGDVHARSVARGRSTGKAAPDQVRTLRARSSQALQDGGEAGDQQADQISPGPPTRVQPHAQMAALFGGSPASMGGWHIPGLRIPKTTPPQPLTQMDIQRQLYGAGISPGATTGTTTPSTQPSTTPTTTEPTTTPSDDTDGGAAAPSPENLPAGSPSGEDIYNKMLTAFQNSNVVGTVPPDGPRFGITTGSAEEYARFATAVAKAESGFNPRSRNLSDPGGSFGVFQYSHPQAYGNAYDVDNSVKAFVRDAEASAGGLRRGILGRRFSTIGNHPDRTVRNLATYNARAPARPPPMMVTQARDYQEGGDVDADSRDEPQQAQDAAEAAAARVRARYPTRPPDPLTMRASQLPWSAFLPSEERALHAAGALQRGEDYDPRDVFLSAIGAVGAPVAGLTREAATLGAGAVRRAAAAVPEVRGGLTAAERAAPLEGAPFPQYAEEYPPIGPGTPTPKTKGSTETYLAKTLTPESEQFEKARTQVIADMKKNGYTPYFDPGERSLVDPNAYPAANVDTLELSPVRQDSIDRYMAQIGAPQTRQLLRQAYKSGQKLGNAHDWYFMGQLEREFINELGPEAGREAFMNRFAVPMAATTSGNQPTANMLIAHYLNYLHNKGLPMPSGAWETPPGVGGRFFMTNVRDYEKIMGEGGYGGLGADQPKMHNFARSFMGDLSRAVMDEQMATGMLAHAGKRSLADPARKTAYGLLERPVHQEAARLGIEPGAFQDVAWAGFKGEQGKPMIEHVNDAIERTHRLTGMPRDEIVRRALIRGETPLYTTGAVPIPGLGREEDNRQ